MTVQKPSESSPKTSGRARPAAAALDAQGAPMPAAQPSVDLLALQQIIASRPPLLPPNGASGVAPPLNPWASSNVAPAVQRLTDEKAPSGHADPGQTPAGQKEKDGGAALLSAAPDEPRTADVLDAHTAEIRDIMKYLHDGAPPERVLGVLSMLPAPNITVLWRYFVDTESVPRRQMERFLDALTLPHLEQYARECVGSFRAWPTGWRVERILSLLHTGAFDDVDPREATLALYLTYELGQADLDQLRAHDNGRTFLRLRDRLPPVVRDRLMVLTDPAREARLRALEAQRSEEARGEAYATGSGGGPDADKRRRHYDELSGRLEKLLAGKVDSAAAHEAQALFTRSLADEPTGTELRALVRELEPDGGVERFIRALPEADRYAFTDDRMLAFLGVLQALPAESAIALVVDLLSTGVIDRVDAQEARLAYEIMRAQPLQVQAAIRSRDDGQLIARLERALPEQFVTTSTQLGLTRDRKGNLVLEAQGFGTASTAEDRARSRRAEDALGDLPRDSALLDRLRGVVRALRERDSIENAREAWAFLVSVQAAERDALVRRLDALGLLERMLARIGAAELFTTRRDEAIAVLASRDTALNIEHLRRLTEAEKVNPLDARLAFLVFRALPAADREELRSRRPEWWSRLQQGLGFSGRHAADTNFYEGGAGGADRVSLLSQLADPQLWDAAPRTPAAMQLRNVVLMATAAGLGERVHHYAREYHAFPKHEALLHDVGIADTKEYGYVPGSGPAAPEEKGTGAVLGALATQVGPRGAVGVRGFDVDVYQDYGKGAGDVAGVEFDRNAPPALNRLDVSFSREEGRLEARALAGFTIRRSDLRVGDVTVRTGAATLGPLDIIATFPTEKNPRQPNRLLLGVRDTSVLHDIVIVMPDRIVAIAEVRFTALQVISSELPFDPASITTVAAAHERLQGLRDTSDLVDGFTLIGRALKAYFDRAAVTEELVRGVATPDQTGPGNASMTVNSIELVGFTSSDGSHADSVTITDFELGVKHTPSGVLRSCIAELEKRMAASRTRIQELASIITLSFADEHERERIHAEYLAMEQEIAALREQLPAREKRDQRYVELYGRDRRGEPLSVPERRELEALRKEMTTGISLSVGRFEVTGAGRSPGEHTDRFSASGITAHAEGVGLQSPLAGVLTDPTVLTRAPEAVPGVGAIGFAVDRVNIHGLHTAGAALDYRVLHARRERLLALAPDKRSEAERRALLDLDMQFQTPLAGGQTFGEVVDKILALDERLATIRGDTSAAADHTAERSLRAERDAYLRQLASASQTLVQSVDVRGISADSRSASGAGQDGDRTTTGLVKGSVGEVRVTGLQSGDKKIGSLELDDVRGGGLATIFDTRGGRITDLVDGRIEAGRVHAADVEGAGAHAEAIDVRGLTAQADTRHDGGTAGLHAQQISVTGVRRAGLVSRLEAEERALTALPKRTALQDERLAEIKKTLADLAPKVARIKGLAAHVADLQQRLAVASGRERRPLEAQLLRAQADLRVAQEAAPGAVDQSLSDLNLDDIGITATGLGDLLSSGYQLEGREVTLTLHLGDLKSGPLQLGDGATSVAFADAQVTGLDVGVTVRATRNVTTGALEVTPVELTALDLGKAHVRSLDASFPLTRQVKNDPGKDGHAKGFRAVTEAVRIVMPQATLEGIHARGIPLTGDVAFKAGSFQADTIRLQVEATLGKYFRAGGALNVRGIALEALSSGAVTVDLRGGLTAEKLGFTASGDVPPDSLVAKLRGMSAFVNRVTLAPSTTTLDPTGAVTVALGTLTVSQVRYAAGNRVIEAKKQVTLEGVRVRARLGAPAAGGKPARPTIIEELRVSRLTADGLHFQDGAGRDAVAFDLRHGVIEDVLLTAINIDTGALNADVGSAQLQGGHFTQGPELGRAIELKLDVAAKGLHYARLLDGTYVIKIGDLGGAVSGQVYGTKVDAALKGATTGAQGITITDSMVHVPSFTIPSLTLNSFNYQGESAGVRTLPGGKGTATGVQVKDLVIALAPPAPGRPRVQWIGVQELKFIEVSANGLEIAIHGDTETVVQVPAGMPATLRGFLMKDFVLDRVTDGLQIGSLGLEKADIAELRDGVGKTLAHRIYARDVGLTTLTADGKTVDVTEAHAKELGAVFGEHSAVKVSRLDVRGIHHDKDDGSTTIQSASLGFAYDDGNFYIDTGETGSISLPSGLRVPKGPGQLRAFGIAEPEAGPITLPNVTLREVHFGIRRVDELLEDDGKGSSGRSLLDYKFLDTISGNIAAIIHLHNIDFRVENILILDDYDLPINIPIIGGTVNFKELERRLPKSGNVYIDFTLEHGQYLTVSTIGHSVIGDQWICRWDLGLIGPDHDLYTKHGTVRLSTLPDIEMAPSDPEKPNKITTDISDVNARLSMFGPSHINLKGGQRIRLGDEFSDGLLNFTAKSEKAEKGTGIELTLEALNITGVQNLRLGDRATLSTSASGGWIVIQNMHDTHLTLDGLKPKTLEGVIGVAQARNLQVHRKTPFER